MKLLREHWLDADDLRMRFFERVSRAGRLGAELAAVRATTPAFNQAAAAGRWAQAEDQNPAAVRMLAEGEAWRCHFEAAAPIFLAIENDFPADASVGTRTVAVYRSLGTIDPKFTDTAIAAGTKLSEANPRSTQTLTRLGEMEAERDKFDRAARYWDRIPEIEPGKADSYLEAATIYLGLLPLRRRDADDRRGSEAVAIAGAVRLRERRDSRKSARVQPRDSRILLVVRWRNQVRMQSGG